MKPFAAHQTAASAGQKRARTTPNWVCEIANTTRAASAHALNELPLVRHTTEDGLGVVRHGALVKRRRTRGGGGGEV